MEGPKLPKLPKLPRISLVTPSLNQAQFLEATVESVLSQGYPDLEYSVVDGGSTDGSVDLLRSYGERVRWSSGPDAGQSDAVNRGLREATGEVLGYLNSDDVLLPGALGTVGEIFASDPEAVLVYGRAMYVDAGGRDVAPYLSAPWDPRRLEDFCLVPQPAAFWRRCVRDEVGEFDVSLHHAMDYDYWLRIAARFPAARVRHVERFLAGFRLHDAAKSVGGWGRGLDEIMDLVHRRAGYVSLWWCVAKWDHRIDGRHQASAPHPVPWMAYPPALAEFAARNGYRPRLLWRGVRGGLRGLRKRLKILGSGL